MGVGAIQVNLFSQHLLSYILLVGLAGREEVTNSLQKQLINQMKTKLSSMSQLQLV
jgi:hypothetical protein